MKTVFYFLFIFISVRNYSQTLQKIKFQKNSSFVYFFSKNNISDSIIKNNNDLFYLIIPDSLKKNIHVFVENAQFTKTKNDSLIKINYMPGLKYETQYIISEEQTDSSSTNPAKQINMVSLINGVSVYPKNGIHVQIINKREEKVIIDNVFFYKN